MVTLYPPAIDLRPDGSRAFRKQWNEAGRDNALVEFRCNPTGHFIYVDESVANEAAETGILVLPYQVWMQGDDLWMTPSTCEREESEATLYSPMTARPLSGSWWMLSTSQAGTPLLPAMLNVVSRAGF